MADSEDNDFKAEPQVVKSSGSSSKQNHDMGMWLTLKRADTVIKYLQLAALVSALVLDRLDISWFEEKYFWWTIGGTVLLNLLIQWTHMALYYVANRYAKDKFYWPRVFPKEWMEGDYGSGFSQHYKFFYAMKVFLLVYIGFMVFQEKLDGFFLYVSLQISMILIAFDLLFYVFDLQ